MRKGESYIAIIYFILVLLALIVQGVLIGNNNVGIIWYPLPFLLVCAVAIRWVPPQKRVKYTLFLPLVFCAVCNIQIIFYDAKYSFNVISASVLSWDIFSSRIVHNSKALIQFLLLLYMGLGMAFAIAKVYGLNGGLEKESKDLDA